MPIYDFKCYDCNEVIGLFFHMNEERVAPICSKCGKETKRIFGTPLIDIRGWSPMNELRGDREVARINEIQAEGITCESEMLTGIAMEKERLERKRKSGELPSAKIPGEENKKRKSREQLAKENKAQLQMTEKALRTG